MLLGIDLNLANVNPVLRGVGFLSRPMDILDSDGNSFTVSSFVLDSDSNSFNVSSFVLDSDGNSFGVI